jgi:hypothetical protein
MRARRATVARENEGGNVVRTPKAQSTAPAARQAAARRMTRPRRTTATAADGHAGAAADRDGDASTPVRQPGHQNPSFGAGPAQSLRQRDVAEAAYFKAMARGFEPGRELDDWFAAERELGTCTD